MKHFFCQFRWNKRGKHGENRVKKGNSRPRIFLWRGVKEKKCFRSRKIRDFNSSTCECFCGAETLEVFFCHAIFTTNSTPGTKFDLPLAPHGESLSITSNYEKYDSHILRWGNTSSLKNSRICPAPSRTGGYRVLFYTVSIFPIAANGAPRRE